LAQLKEVILSYGFGEKLIVFYWRPSLAWIFGIVEPEQNRGTKHKGTRIMKFSGTDEGMSIPWIA